VNDLASGIIPWVLLDAVVVMQGLMPTTIETFLLVVRRLEARGKIIEITSNFIVLVRKRLPVVGTQEALAQK
jgi:hypothetical protein